MMLEDMIEYRRALHCIPELENHLPKTCAFVKAQLQGLGCTVTEPIEGAVCAFFDEGKEDTLAFRADMDALPITEQTGLPFSSEHPGKMHACGHDGHTAMLLGLAKTVAARHGTLRYNVLLVFQPAEENPGGARPLCRSGIFARCHVRAIFGFHLWPGLPLGEIATRPGALMAKSSESPMQVHGKSVHISKYQEGADSLLAASTFLQRVYAMEREVFPPETPRLLKFGRMEAGRIRNAIAADAVLEGSLRAFTLEDFAALRRRCEEIAAQVGRESNCAMELAFSEGYPPVTNDPAQVAAIEAQLGADAPRRYEGLALTTEDFAWYQQELPGVFFFLGVGDTEELHSARFTFDERVLERGRAFYEKLLDLSGNGNRKGV